MRFKTKQIWGSMLHKFEVQSPQIWGSKHNKFEVQSSTNLSFKTSQIWGSILKKFELQYSLILRFNPPQIWGSILNKFEVQYTKKFEVQYSTNLRYSTVGAQSIAHEQSIARWHTTYVIMQKNLHFKNFFFERLRRSNLKGGSSKKRVHFRL